MLHFGKQPMFVVIKYCEMKADGNVFIASHARINSKMQSSKCCARRFGSSLQTTFYNVG